MERIIKFKYRKEGETTEREVLVTQNLILATPAILGFDVTELSKEKINKLSKAWLAYQEKYYQRPPSFKEYLEAENNTSVEPKWRRFLKENIELIEKDDIL